MINFVDKDIYQQMAMMHPNEQVSHIIDHGMTLSPQISQSSQDILLLKFKLFVVYSLLYIKKKSESDHRLGEFVSLWRQEERKAHKGIGCF